VLVDICSERSLSFALFILVASANGSQRRPDDDIHLEIRGPEASRTARRLAAKQRDAEKK
jgi:hypothetical protein